MTLKSESLLFTSVPTTKSPNRSRTYEAQEDRSPTQSPYKGRDARVILHGEVESASQRDAAESAVLHLTGVRVVDSLLKVKSESKPTAADIELRVHEAIAHTADLHARSIRVTMNDNTVHLHGHLPSLAALQTALRAAETAPGIKAVESEIVVES